MIVEGINTIRELLKSNYEIEKIIIDDKKKEQGILEIINLARYKNIPVEYVKTLDLFKLCKSKAHQGIIAFVKQFIYSSVDEILHLAKELNEDNFIVILDGIQDPHNMGSIIRTCECAGVHGIIIQKTNSCTVNETVFKTSAGAVAHIKIAQVTNINDCIKLLKQSGVWVYGLEANGKDISNVNLGGNICLVIGSEGFGIRPLVKKNCDEILSLKMKGKVNSLNASNAAAIAIYKVLDFRK